jgi:mRNA interferase MazF
VASKFPHGVPRRGEIYWIHFGKGRGSEQAGHRPAVIVSNNTINTTSPTVIVAALTRAKQKKNYPQNVRLPAGKPLPDEQTILCGQLLTLDKRRLQRHHATLDESQMPELDRALSVGLGIRIEPSGGQVQAQPEPRREEGQTEP